MYKTLNIDYDKAALLALYNEHKDGDSNLKGGFLELDFDDIVENTEIIRLFDILEFFGEPDERHVALMSLVKTVGPHCLPACNGMIIFPIVGSFITKFYSYKVPVIHGRPTLQGPLPDPAAQQALLESFVDDVIIDRPTAVDGLCPHQDYKIDDECIFLAFKVPAHIDWESVTEFINSLEG
jgi:hypothetical protein